MGLQISAFFPAHNEEANIEALTRKTAKVLSEICDDYEVIIVNDGSKDRTKEIGEALAKENPKIRLINHEINKGYGAAVKSGLYGARLTWVFFTDGDGQFDVNEIKELAKYTNEADFITGYRIKRADSFMRKLNAFMWGSMVKLLFHFKVRDVDCAFKLFKKEIIDRTKPEAEGAMISTELLAKANKLGYKIKEVGEHHYPRTAGTQTGAKMKVILRAFVELFKLYNRIK
jgi:glycosyltransferase involved in cell wall biosynthesis